MQVQSPKELADHLRLLVDDEDFIVRAVRLKFPQYGETGKGHPGPRPRMSPIPLVQPVVAAPSGCGKEYISRDDPATTADGPDRAFHAGMEGGSRKLLEAIKSGRGPDAFIWSLHPHAGNWEPDPDSMTSSLRTHRVTLIQEREAFTDTLRVSRDPCFKCGARADVGCKHRRVA